MVTWRKKISCEMSVFGENWFDVEAIAGQEHFDVPFDDGYGLANGQPFTVWTAKRVYFPVCYDGSEWVGSVSRNPDGLPTWHMGM